MNRKQETPDSKCAYNQATQQKTGLAPKSQTRIRVSRRANLLASASSDEANEAEAEDCHASRLGHRFKLSDVGAE